MYGNIATAVSLCDQLSHPQHVCLKIWPLIILLKPFSLKIWPLAIFSIVIFWTIWSLCNLSSHYSLKIWPQAARGLFFARSTGECGIFFSYSL